MPAEGVGNTHWEIQGTAVDPVRGLGVWGRIVPEIGGIWGAFAVREARPGIDECPCDQSLNSCRGGTVLFIGSDTRKMHWGNEGHCDGHPRRARTLFSHSL
jgi:hypothetical protein